MYNLNPAKQGAVDILEYNSDTNTHISNDLEFSFNSRLPNGSVVFGGWTAQHNIEVTCDQENPNGSAANDLYFDYQHAARRPVLRRAEHGHPIPPRLQVRRHAAA